MDPPPLRRHRRSLECGLLEDYPRAATFSCESIGCISHWIEGIEDHTDGISESPVLVLLRG